MEPHILAALITAGTNVGTSIFQKWSGGQKDVKADSFVKEHYDAFRTFLDDDSVKVLKRLEDGQNHALAELRRCVHPELAFHTREDEDRFNTEFEFRLRYLELIGLLVRPAGQYFITKAGASFCGEARAKRDFFHVFFT